MTPISTQKDDIDFAAVQTEPPKEVAPDERLHAELTDRLHEARESGAMHRVQQQRHAMDAARWENVVRACEQGIKQLETDANQPQGANR